MHRSVYAFGGGLLASAIAGACATGNPAGGNDQNALGAGGSFAFAGAPGGGAPPVGGTGSGGVLPPPGGGSSALGGAPASGGAPAGGGAPANGGTGNAGAPAECAPGGATLDPNGFPPCPTCADKPAHCVPTTIITSVAPDQIAQLTPCDATSLCVPDTFITTVGNYDPPSCPSIKDGAGRCLSVCIGAVANLNTFLPQANCPDGEKCAPCTDPRTGAATGACSLKCDTGPEEPSVVFPRCCTDSTGICVPPDLLDETQKKALGAGTCTGGDLCAPEKFADGSFRPKTCASVAGAEGRCVSTCVDLVGKLAELLPKDVCDAGELCAPCTDPRSGEITGACNLNGDAPTEPPVIFDTQCCESTGLCVPQSAVPARYSALLPADICASDGGQAGWVCAPKVKLEDLSAPLPKCQVMILGFPVLAPDPNQFGACIPKCIADSQIAGNPLTALGLAPSDCQAGWLCAPCVNPLDGKRTGACD